MENCNTTMHALLMFLLILGRGPTRASSRKSSLVKEERNNSETNFIDFIETVKVITKSSDKVLEQPDQLLWFFSVKPVNYADMSSMFFMVCSRRLSVSACWFSSHQVDILTSLNPWFRDGRLEIEESWSGKPEVSQEISRCLLYLFKFRAFSDTRWATMGPSTRALVASMGVGLDTLVRSILRDPSTSNYYLGGYFSFLYSFV